MRYRRSIVTGLAALVAAGTAAADSGRAATAAPEVWVAPATAPYVTFGPDGAPQLSDAAHSWRAPLAERLASDASMDAFAAEGADRLAVLSGAAPDRVVAQPDSASSSAAAVSVGRITPEIDTVGDLDGDGAQELLVHRNSETFRQLVALRSGGDGSLRWERELPEGAYLVTAESTSGPVLFLFEQRKETRSSYLSLTTDLVVSVSAVASDGSTAWTRELRGTETRGVLTTQLRDVPIVEGVGDVRGDGAADVVVMLAGARRSNHTGVLLPSSEHAAIAILDGSDGSLVRGPEVAGSRTFHTMGDVDGDGKGDVYEQRRVGSDGASGVVGGDTEVRWLTPEPLSPSRGFAAGIADLDGDGDADVLSHHLGSCDTPGASHPCTIEIAALARDGATGSELERWDTWPRVAAQVDADPAVETLVAEAQVGHNGQYGVRLVLADVNGDVAHRTERLRPMPEEPWRPYVILASDGDVDADGVTDWSWEIGRFDPSYRQPSVLEDKARVSGATAAPLPPLELPNGWSSGRFDLLGDDHFWFEPPGDTVRVVTQDGFDGSAIWSSALEHPQGPVFAQLGDLRGAGRDDVLMQLLGTYPSYRLERLVLLDGETGAVRWDRPVQPA